MEYRINKNCFPAVVTKTNMIVQKENDRLQVIKVVEPAIPREEE